MKLIIAGSRHLYSQLLVIEALKAFVGEYGRPKEIVSGCAEGIDRSAPRAAQLLDVGFKKFPADWDKHGKSAGPIRNFAMAEYADALLLIWNGKSKGSKNMLMNAKKMGLLIKEVIVHDNNP